MERLIDALKIMQWLPEWNNSDFDKKQHRAKPPEFFYFFSLDAKTLCQLSDVKRRKSEGVRHEDHGMQRRLIPDKVEEIKRFVNFGFPVSENVSLCRTLMESMTQGDSSFGNVTARTNSLIMPGWLPTAIIANIKSYKEMKEHCSEQNTIVINENNQIVIPDIADYESDNFIKPLRIIDGQHRLFAVSDIDDPNYQLPVIAFYNLDVAWEAYLFYTINIKPKRINSSLAYDLYPLLRTQNWLDGSPSKANIYRDARAQELVEALWSYDGSMWKNRINMLGDPDSGTITQAAFIRAISTSFLRSRDHKLYGKGLFSSNLGLDDAPLPWTRTQQAAYLIVFWLKLESHINQSKYEWALKLREAKGQKKLIADYDQAVESKDSLLATDQGVRVLMLIFNKLSVLYYENAENRGDNNSFKEWVVDAWVSDEYITNEQIKETIDGMPKRISDWIQEQVVVLSSFDWQNSSSPGLSKEEKLMKSAYRGSSGYKILFELIEDHIRTNVDGK